MKHILVLNSLKITESLQDMATVRIFKFNQTYKRSNSDETDSHKQGRSTEEGSQVFHSHDPGHHQGEEGDIYANAESPDARYHHHPLDVRHEGEN